MSRLWSVPSMRSTALLVACAVGLYSAASVGMCDLAGFSSMAARFSKVEPAYLVLSAVAVLVAVAVYGYAWEGIVHSRGGPSLTRREKTAASVVGFGPFLARGGGTVDRHVLRSTGLSRREVAVRVDALDALEHVPVALVCCGLAIATLAVGGGDPPPLDFLWPWAVAPPLGAALAIGATWRVRDRWRDRSGVTGRLSIGFDAIYVVWQMAATPPRRGLPLLAMSAFWTAEIVALWSAIRAFGFSMAVVPLVFAYVVGYVVTRRPAPLGGAGLLDLFVPLCLWDCGAPLAAAVAGSIVYRFFSLWLVLPVSLIELSPVDELESPAEPEPEPALRPRGDSEAPGQS